MTAEMLVDATTQTQCRVRVYDHPEIAANLGEGLILALTMDDPGDGRHAEVYLDPEVIEQLRVGLNAWAESHHR